MLNSLGTFGRELIDKGASYLTPTKNDEKKDTADDIDDIEETTRLINETDKYTTLTNSEKQNMKVDMTNRYRIIILRNETNLALKEPKPTEIEALYTALRGPTGYKRGSRFDWKKYSSSIDPILKRILDDKLFLLGEMIQILTNISADPEWQSVRGAVYILSGKPQPAVGKSYIDMPFPYDKGSRASMIDMYNMLLIKLISKQIVTVAMPMYNILKIEYELSLESGIINDIKNELYASKLEKTMIAESKIVREKEKIEKPSVNRVIHPEESAEQIKSRANYLAKKFIGNDVDIAAELGITLELQKMRRLQTYYAFPLKIDKEHQEALEKMRINTDKTMRIKYLQNMFVFFENHKEHELKSN